MRRNRLDTVFKLRSIAERQARVELARSTRAELEAADELARRQAQHDDRATPGEPLEAARLRGLHLQGVRSHELVEKAAEAFRAAEETTALDRLGWTRASAEAEAVERLEERRRREAAELAARAAADILDDLASLLHAMRTKRKET